MKKQELIETFARNHNELIAYVNSLSDEQFMYRYNEKWTAGQQLNHCYLCLLPFPKALASKEYILQKFGKINRPTWNFDTLVDNYLKTSRKAPEQFLPEQILPEQKAKITADFQEIIPTIQQLLEKFTDEELDNLVLPHPLLGIITIKEMFYLMSYHPIHHLKQIKQYLKNH